MILRKYQEESVFAVWDFLRNRTGNPCVVLPTGAGKSLVLARLASDAATLWGGRVVILAHVKELLEQNAEKLQRIAPNLDLGIYSAGLKKRDRKSQVLVAGIQSVYSRACDFDPFDLIIVDEAHLIPPDGDGMYRKFLSDAAVIAPHVRLIGLTATPYRLGSGLLCGPDELLTDVCYEAGIKELIQGGFLSKLTSKEGMACDTGGLHVRGGEFIADEAEKLMLDVVGPACQEIQRKTVGRRSVLVFCQSVEHAIQVTAQLRTSGSRVELVTGDTPTTARAEYLKEFKAGSLKFLVNVNVLTTGFDAPNTDAICLLRPTLSPGLYYQMVGRGFRTAERKQNCLVLDFAGNIKRHGPVDQVKIKARSAGGRDPVSKTCPQCAEVCHAGYSQCPDCGFQFDDKTKAMHEAKASTSPVTTLEILKTEWTVLDVTYSKHLKKKDSAAPPTLRVEYKVAPTKWLSEWVCIEHEGFAGSKARSWWKARSNDPFPESVDAALDSIEGGAVAVATHITVTEKANEFPRVSGVRLGPKPEGIEKTDGDPSWDFPKPGDEEETALTDERVYLW